MQFRVIIVHEALKVGMEVENFAFIMPTISNAYGTFCLTFSPFHDSIF